MQIELHVDWPAVALVGVLIVVTSLLSSCTVLGTGRSTLVLADPPPSGVYQGQEFNHLIKHGNTRTIGLQDTKPRTEAEWNAFKAERLSSAYAVVAPAAAAAAVAVPAPTTAYSAASIDINVRDQTITPPLDLFNIETVTASDLAKILTDHTLTGPQKDALLTQLRDNFRGMPETYSRLVSHGIDAAGSPQYYYFPQVTIDLTGTLNTAETLDRFDFIAAAIRIPGVPTDGVKFINFSPKAADLFDFTLGQLKQTASATASANAANKVTTGSSTTNKPTGGPETGSALGGELGYGGSASFTLTDELTRDMKSSLEARSAGIIQNGKLFIIELRSNEQKHIAGTYSFNVMMQVPSTVEKNSTGSITTWKSKPTVTAIKAQVRIVGIVRHVVKPGRTGTFKRVPEPLNDETYREVVLRDEPVTLWEYTNLPIGQQSIDTNLDIYSNVDGAGFQVIDEKTHKMVGYGSGREAHLTVDSPNTVRVVFTNAVVGGDKPVVLKASEVTGITLGKGAVAIGSYAP